MKCKCRKLRGSVPSAICNCNGNKMLVMGNASLGELISCKKGEEREIVLPLVNETTFLEEERK
jgi:hypothetical protein|tara:strand:+ start:327 stop:515 length:189 start_codon:yes stop_codon:yes gene_type:complete